MSQTGHQDQQSSRQTSLDTSMEYPTIQIGGLYDQTDILHTYTDSLKNQPDNPDIWTKYSNR